VLEVGERHARHGKAGGAGEARSGEVDQRLAVGRLVGGCACCLQRLRPDRSDAALLVELEIYSRIALANAQDAYDQAIGRYPSDPRPLGCGW